jgi:CBS domain-containing protein
MLRLGEIMSRDVITVTPDTSVRDAMELLAKREVGGAPVVSGNEVVGVVSIGDLITLAADVGGVPTERDDQADWGDWAEQTTAEEVEAGDLSDSAFFSEMWSDAGAEVTERLASVSGPEWDVLEEHDVSEAMTRRIWSVHPDQTVAEAARVMRDAGIHRLLVVDGKRLAGIVTTMDIANAVARGAVDVPPIPAPRSHHGTRRSRTRR